MSTLSTAVIAALPSFLVGVATGAWRQSQRLAQRLWSTVQLDHRSLTSGGYVETSFPLDGPEGGVRLHITCAPSRAYRTIRFDSGRAEDLGSALLGDGAAAAISSSGGLCVEQGTAFRDADYVWLCSNGKVDLVRTYSVASDNPDDRELDGRPLLTQIADLHEVMHFSAYRQMHRLRWWRRLQRLDWRIGVSTYSFVPDRGTVSAWTALRIGTIVPKRAAASQRSMCPPAGYGGPELRGSLWRCTPTRETLLMTFLENFLKENGYRRVSVVAKEALRVPLTGATEG